jgi:hypothetical protein
VSELRSCIVPYRDPDGVKHSVQVTAESLFEAAILGMKAMKVPNWENVPNLEIEVRERAPETRHLVWNSVLTAWLARNGKSPKEQALRVRLRELIRC